MAYVHTKLRENWPTGSKLKWNVYPHTHSLTHSHTHTHTQMW
jgi:hypothetical protein